MRPYYSEFVRHCLRFYVTTLDVGSCPKFNTEVEKNNWVACHRAMKNVSPEDLEIIKEIYSPGDTIPDKIYNLSKELKVSQGDISVMIGKLERDVAKKRGLL